MINLGLWFRALRPFSFTASIIPVLLGTVLAIKEGYFDLGLFILTLLGALLLHSGTNLINDYYDYKIGIDTKDSYGSSGILVEELIQPYQIRNFGYICLLLVIPIALYLSYLRGIKIGLLILFGLIGGYFYTGRPINYKYYALGVPMVFILMGPLMVIGAYYVQTGNYNTQVLWTSLPLGLLVSAILHSNDFRDIKHDSKVGIRTLSILLGRNLAGKVYLVLVGLPYLFLVFLVSMNIVTSWSLITLITLPYAINNITIIRRSIINPSKNIKNIDLKTAQLHFKFGILFILAVVGSKLIG